MNILFISNFTVLPADTHFSLMIVLEQDMISFLNERYLLEEKVGEGAHGTVIVMQTIKTSIGC
jgi:hypothetical protein